MKTIAIVLQLLIAMTFGGPCGAAVPQGFVANAPITRVTNRDNTGTSNVPKMTDNPQSLVFTRSASGQQLEAEGMGLEPTTGCPAPEFQSGR